MAQAEWLSQRVEARWSPKDPALMAHTPRVHWPDCGGRTWCTAPAPQQEGPHSGTGRVSCHSHGTCSRMAHVPRACWLCVSLGCGLNSVSVLCTVCCASPSPVQLHASLTQLSTRPSPGGRTWNSGRGGPASEGSSLLPDPVPAVGPLLVVAGPCQVVGTKDSPCLLDTCRPVTLLHSGTPGAMGA